MCAINSQSILGSSHGNIMVFYSVYMEKNLRSVYSNLTAVLTIYVTLQTISDDAEKNLRNYQWLKTQLLQTLLKGRLKYLPSHSSKKKKRKQCYKIVVIWRGDQRASSQKVSGKQR